MTDEQIKTSIKGGFFWSPFVDSGDIKVSVNGGVATLTGTVGTRIGWNEASRDAYNGGATKVVNQVKITHSAWWWWCSIPLRPAFAAPGRPSPGTADLRRL